MLFRSYYHQAHACVLVFDATRKITYKNLNMWYQELRWVYFYNIIIKGQTDIEN